MNRGKAFLALATLGIIVISSSLGIYYSVLQEANIPKVSETSSAIKYRTPILYVPLTISAVSYNDISNNQTTKMQIYNFVAENPGTHFRGIARGLSLPIGVVQYHLWRLVKDGSLTVQQDGRYRRYFRSKRFKEVEMKIISLLRHTTTRSIMVVLSERGSVTHGELASELNISSQALTWQMNCLRKTGLISTEVERIKVSYNLNEEGSLRVKECIEKIRNE